MCWRSQLAGIGRAKCNRSGKLSAERPGSRILVVVPLSCFSRARSRPNDGESKTDSAASASLGEVGKFRRGLGVELSGDAGLLAEGSITWRERKSWGLPERFGSHRVEIAKRLVRYGSLGNGEKAVPYRND